MRLGDWIYEIKFDGYRALAVRGPVRPLAQSKKFPEIVDSIGQLSPADISRHVRPEPRHASPRWSINGYVALVADETSGSGVIDHYPKELQVAVAVSPAMRKEATGGLRINQFRPEVLNFARKNLRALNS